MKNYLFLTAIAFAMLFTACSKDDKFDENEKNGGRQVTVTEYQWEFGERSTMGDLYEKYTYDKNDNLIKFESNYNVSNLGRIPNSITYKYDEQNHLIEKNTYTLSVLSYKYKYTFNDIDSVASMQRYDDEGDLLESWEYTYDNQRRLLRAKEIYDYGIAYVEDYAYAGNTVTVVTRRTDTGALFGTTLYEYDNYHNLLKKTWTNGETGKKSVSTFNEYTYNSKGQITRMIIHGTYVDTDLTYRDYMYNDDGTLQRIHISYSYKTSQSDLDYSYSDI